MRLLLPPAKDKEAVARAIDAAIAPAINERNVYQIGWYVTDLYLQGVRNFTLMDYDTGVVEYFYDEDSGPNNEYDRELYQGVPFRWEDALTRIQTELGRLSRLDTSPRVSKRTRSIQSMKDASLAQALLDEMVSRYDKRVIDIGFRTMAVLYGTAGLGHWREETANSLGFEWELIPPWELLAFPAGSPNPGDRRADGRTRLVPMQQIEKDPRFRLDRIPEEDLEIQELPFGSGPMTRTAGGEYSNLYRDASQATGGKRKVKVEKAGHAERFGRLTEIFVPGPSGSISRYIAKVGQAIVADSDLDDVPLSSKRIPYPLGIGRYIDTGRFFGRSFASKVVPYCMRMEHLMKELITNVEDFDRFGYMIIPNGLGIGEESFKPTRGPKYVFADWDPMASREPIQQLVPSTSSDMPGRVLQLMAEQADRVTSQSPMLQGMATGRVDSGVGFDRLWEAGSTHLNITAESFEMAYSTVYRSMLGQAAEAVESGKLEAIDLIRIEPTMIGLQIDRSTGVISLKGEKLPDPWKVDIGIQSSDPALQERRRQEAFQFLQAGVLDVNEFAIMNYREDWGYPIGKEDIWESYVKATLDCLILFGDGQQPGELSTNIYFDKPFIHKLALDHFVGSAAFALASPEVQAAFEQRVLDLEAMMGRRTPMGLPTADQSAMNEAMKTQQQMMAQKQAIQQQQKAQKQGGQPGLMGGR